MWERVRRLTLIKWPLIDCVKLRITFVNGKTITVKAEDYYYNVHSNMLVYTSLDRFELHFPPSQLSRVTAEPSKKWIGFYG